MRKHSELMLRRAGVSVVTLSMLIAVFASPLNGSTTVSQAASKPKLESAKGTILTGESETVKIKNVKKKKIKKLTVSSSKKSVATAKKAGKTAFTVRSKKAGKATVKATVKLKNNRKYKLKYVATVADIVDRKVPVHSSVYADSSLSLRFFSGTPHVPYIRISTFYNTMTRGKELKVQKTAGNEYTLTDPDGDTATVNTETDVLSSDKILDFISVSTTEADSLSEDTDEIAPYLKSQPEVTIEPPKPVSLSFADYGIDIIGDTDDIWLPFETAANLFISFYGATMYYNGTSIFRSISIADVEYLYGKKWTKEYDLLYPDGVRPADLADYCYREMMFLLDTQWGNPGRCYFADAIREKGMDRALSETDDVTRAVQKLLKSTSLKDYMIGLGILNDMLFDGGHTSLTYILDPYMAVTGTTLETVYSKFCTDMEAVADKIGYQMKNLTDDYWQANYDVTESRGWSGYSYHEQGDTAIFSFDAFEADSDAWKEYYKNGGELPNDTYGNFIKYLKKATESGTIKNFVLDLTANAGGQTSVYCAMFALMGYPSDSYFKQVKTGCLYNYQLEIDRNLDGKFDEADDAVKYPFHYAILTSRASYSSGNIMPFLAKEYGIMTLGEASRGGGFAETLTSSPDGLVWFYSGPLNITDRDGRSADPSVEPDKAIEVKTDADGYPDYSAFYDIPALSGYINEFYNKK